LGFGAGAGSARICRVNAEEAQNVGAAVKLNILAVGAAIIFVGAVLLGMF
jgi:hypothetical protein